MNCRQCGRLFVKAPPYQVGDSVGLCWVCDRCSEPSCQEDAESFLNETIALICHCKFDELLNRFRQVDEDDVALDSEFALWLGLRLAEALAEEGRAWEHIEPLLSKILSRKEWGARSARQTMPSAAPAPPAPSAPPARATWRLAKFQLEGVEGGPWEGWTDGSDWNGFARPAFPDFVLSEIDDALFKAGLEASYQVTRLPVHDGPRYAARYVGVQTWTEVKE